MNMRSLRVIAPLALGAAVLGLAVAPRVSTSSPPAEAAVADQVPVAHAAGGDVALPFPSIVNVRLTRAEAALERATASVDQGQGAQAIVDLTAVRSNMVQAWVGAVYVIKTTPPPAEGAVSAVAAPEDTGFAVINLEHDVITTSVGLLSTTDASVVPELGKTISLAMKYRNKAVSYIHSIAPPPVAGDGRVHADASGAPVGGSWDLVMPGAVPQLEDEMQQAAAMHPSAAVTPTFLPALKTQEAHTRSTINTYWPPVPGD
jgi:hypothetical protein